MARADLIVSSGFDPNSTFTRAAGEEFQAGFRDIPNIFDLGLTPAVFDEVFSVNFANSYQPYFLDLFKSRMQKIPHYSKSWRELAELLYPGRVKSTITGNGSGLSEVELEVFGPNGTNKSWWKESDVFRIDNRSYLVTELTGVSGSGHQKLKVKPFNGVADLEVTGGASVQFANNIEFGHINEASGSNDTSETGRTTDFDVLSNSMTETATYCQVKEAALRHRQILSYDLGNGEKYYYYANDDEIKDFKKHNAMVSNTMIYGELIQDASLDKFSGHGLLQQLPDDVQNPYEQALTIEKWRRGTTEWMELNPDNPPTEVLALCGIQAYADIQRLLEHMTPLIRTMNGTMEKYTGDVFVGQDYVYYHWMGMTFKFVMLPNFSSIYVNPKRSPVNQNVSIYSHDVLLLDMGTKNGINPGSTTSGYKIGMYCPMSPDGKPTNFQIATREGSIDGNGNDINGSVTSFKREFVRKFTSRYMLNLEHANAAYYFSRDI